MPRSLSTRRPSSSARKAPARSPRPAARATRDTAALSAHEDASMPLPSFSDVLFQQGLLTPDHKRGLILAHAHARHARPKVRHWVYISSVAFCSALLLMGWWFTVGDWVRARTQLVDTSMLQRQIGVESARLEQAYLSPNPIETTPEIKK